MSTLVSLKGASGTGKTYACDYLRKLYGVEAEETIAPFREGKYIGPCPKLHHYSNKTGQHDYRDCLHEYNETSCRPVHIFRLRGTDVLVTGTGRGTNSADGKSNKLGYVRKAAKLLERGHVVIDWSRFSSNAFPLVEAMGHRVIVGVMQTPEVIATLQQEKRRLKNGGARAIAPVTYSEADVRRALLKAEEYAAFAFPLTWPDGHTQLHRVLMALGLLPEPPLEVDTGIVAPAPIGTCIYCGDPATVLDHVMPRLLGGSDDPSNLQPACKPCNGLKGAIPVDVFLKHFPQGHKSARVR